MTVAALEAEHAYRECEQITRRAAANFYYGIRLLPREQRQAMSAVYAFARRIDDIGDEAGSAAAKLDALADARADLAAVVAATEGREPLPSRLAADPVILALAAAAHRYALPLEALRMLVDGVELDVRGTHYETFDDLVLYCRDVAGSIGCLCLAIFTGGEAGEHAQLADDLGVALQLTNILRDVREDFDNGRVYLPAEDLRRFGAPDPTRMSVAMIRFEAARADEWFTRGLQLLDHLDGRSAACVRAMSGIYRRILDRIIADPELILTCRIALPPWEKAWVAASSLARGVRG